MVRHDTSDSNMKTIHLKNRKAVDIWNKRRDRGENLSGTISNWLIEDDKRQQEITKANGQAVVEGEELENRVRPPFDFSFVVDPKHYKDERKWMRLLKYAKDQEILDLHEMLEYALKRTIWKAEKIRKEEDAKKLALYREQREIERQEKGAAEKAMQERHDKDHMPVITDIIKGEYPDERVMIERLMGYLKEKSAQECSICNKRYYEAQERLRKRRELVQQQEQQ
jgi:hypothetical protein